MQLNALHLLYAVSAFSIVGYVGFIALFFYGARKAVRTQAREELPAKVKWAGKFTDYPPVSVLKPCAGSDDDLERCLESHFLIDYPQYELIFGVRDASDPAYPVIQKLLNRYPKQDATIVFTGEGRHPNRKVSNLEGISAKAKYEYYWISDSNIIVHPHTLRGLAEELSKPGIGLVVSPVVGDCEESLGAAFDNLHLGAFVTMAGYAAWLISQDLPFPGKSVLFSRADFEKATSWNELGRYCGEDIILCHRLAANGLKFSVARHLITNVNRSNTFPRFFERHLRWAQIRLRTVPTSTFFEPLLGPVITALVLCLCIPSKLTFGIFCFAVVQQFLSELAVMYRLRGRIIAPKFIPLFFVRPFVALILWARGFVASRIEWRGNSFWMGPQSMILSEPPFRARLRGLLERSPS